MFNRISELLATISAFSSYFYHDGVFDVEIDNVLMDENWMEYTPDEYDDELLDNVLDELVKLATSVDYAPYVHDTYIIDDIIVKVTYTSYDI